MHYIAKCHMLDVGEEDMLPVFAFPSLSSDPNANLVLPTDWDKAAKSFWKSASFMAEIAAHGPLDGGASYTLTWMGAGNVPYPTARELLTCVENPPLDEGFEGHFWKHDETLYPDPQGAFVVTFPDPDNPFTVYATISIRIFPVAELFRHKARTTQISPNVSISLSIFEEYVQPVTHTFILSSQSTPNDQVVGGCTFCEISGGKIGGSEGDVVDGHRASFDIKRNTEYSAWE